ncbi:hypothetical protein ACFC57_13765 [Enterococcus hirae]|uniref:hypothetical protein n=1 Tax=Enterococcus hirae TaxID=1354 RepID=UPI0019FD96C4|nr:hypothetical protein [Enterococcus hirae]EMF0206915.1 hypothetical protein [Enterococcus hirae]EMF0226454.1 hypothetical protein [Enterococcus hirae]
MADIKDSDYVVKQLAEEFGVSEDSQPVEASQMLKMIARSQDLYKEKAEFDKNNK